MFEAFFSGVKKRIYKGIPVSEVPKLEGDEVALVRLNLGIAWASWALRSPCTALLPLALCKKSGTIFFHSPSRKK